MTRSSSTAAPTPAPWLALAALLAPGCGPHDPPGDAGGGHAHDDHHDDHHDERPAARAWLGSERDRHDFGTVFQDSVHSTRFELVAAGDDPLVVDEVTRACGCTEGELRAVGEDGELEPVELGRPYPPGTRFDLLATLNTKGKHGKQEQKVHLLLDGKRERATYVLHARIEPFLEVEPALLDVGSFSTLDGVQETVRVASATGEPFALRAETLAPGVDVSFEPIAPGPEARAAAWRMIVTVPPGTSPGVLGHKLMLVSDVPNENAEPRFDASQPPHRREFWVRGVVEGAVTARPERMTFGRLEPGRPTTRKVVLENHDPDFELAGVRVRLEEIDGRPAAPDLLDAAELEARPLEEGRRWELELRLEEVAREGPLQGRIRVLVDHPYQDELVVEFR